MKEKIIVINFDNQYAHQIAKSFRLLEYYSEILFPNVEISELQNAKGIILSPINNSNKNTKITEFNEAILLLDIPILDLRQEKNFSTKYNDNKLFEDFIKKCQMKKNWNANSIIEYIVKQIRIDAENRNVLLFLSGGVKSTVAFALLNKALGKERVLGLHIDNGFMRKDESKIVAQKYIDYGFSNFILEDASQTFLSAIKDIINPQEKRKIIEEKYLDVHNEIVQKQKLLENEWFLSQGSLYPNIIESGTSKNPHVTKTHHNKIAGIEKLISKGLIIEPLKYLYKEEVIILEKKLELPEELVMRHPFPSTGLSVNVLCSNDVLSSQEERELKKANQKLLELDLHLAQELKKDSYSLKALPIKTTGIQSDFKEYKFPAILYLNTKKFPDWNILEKISSKLINSVQDVNRTVLCIYEKENCNLQEQFCTKERLEQTRKVDEIVIKELKASKEYSKIYQHLTINLPYSTTQKNCSIVLRPIVATDSMCGNFAKLPQKVIDKIVEKIKTLEFVDALYYDITDIPPATFTWE